MKTKFSLVVLIALLLGTTMSAQNIEAVVKNYFNGTSAKAEFPNGDFSEWKVTDVVPSLNPDIQHVYVQQYHQDIPIQFAAYKLTVKDGKVTFKIDQFVKDVKTKALTARGSLSAENAIKEVARKHNQSVPAGLVATSNRSDGSIAYRKTSETLEPITAQKIYFQADDGLKLTWRVSYYQADGQHWWVENVDAATGKVIYSEDWVIKCNFGEADGGTHDHKNDTFLHNVEQKTAPSATAAMAPDSYNVYPVPVESPNHGGRSIVTNPADATASPYGWHDTNGAPGAEFTTTRGNNVRAQDDRNGNNGTGFSPDGGATLDFDFPINFNNQPSTFISASITNLFYWNNIMHDVWYQYGFDEASGNFQENNYGRGGAGGDSVNADAQDGSGTNNANFSTPSDGGNPRMQMFLFTNPTRDGDLDNVIIAHEYGHGISIRLVGGPSRNVLGGSEQMGEGWSDWFGLVLTMKAGDVGTVGRGVGTYAIGQPTDGRGIRPTAYSTNRSINNTDYADVNSLVAPHGVGYGFATILWDMTWALIAQEGFDPDFYNGTGGNNIAMALVIEGLKNTANNPGYVSGRDGILQADQDLYAGKYNCLIWTVFSERGVGLNADENNNGGSNGKTDQTVSFVNGCGGGGGGGGGTDECTGDVSSFPYAESFEGSVGAWTQATGDDLDWTVDSGGTPSNGTGPSAAVDGNSYIYVEASGNGTGFPNKQAILNSPCFNFTSLTNAELTFKYHMIGNAVGTFDVEARTGNTGAWTSVFNRTGAQGTDWNTATVDLSAYSGNDSVQLRFNTVTGTSWQGDVTIDDLRIAEANGGGGGGGGGDTGCTADISSYPYNQSFEGNSFPGWANATGNDVNWATDTGGTPSNGTGPSTGSAGATYAYVETSGNGTGYPSKSAVLNAPCFDLSNASVATFNFDYHMQGNAVGSLTVQASADNGVTWADVFSRSGNQGSAWNAANINMTPYIGGTVQLRFSVITGNSWQGDIAIDDINMTEAAAVYSLDGGTPVADLGSGDLLNINVYPSPVKKGAMLFVSNHDSSSLTTSYTVFNLVGQVVAKGMIQDNQINVSALNKGVYILNIKSDEQSSIKKFVVE